MNEIEKHFTKTGELQKKAAQNILETLKRGNITVTIDIINSVYENIRLVREEFLEIEKDYFKDRI